MQKLIILDSETGIATIMLLPETVFTESGEGYDESVENYMESKDYNINSIQWMVALEINDTTK